MSIKNSTKNKLCRLIKFGLIAILTFTFNLAFAQNSTPIEVQGKVTDNKGAGLPGVSVKEKNTQNAVITNNEGKYSITLKNVKATLVFSFVGYTPIEKIVTGSVVNAMLSDDNKSLNDVVVVGYGTQKKATLTGSISEVKGSDLVKSPQPNLTNSLAGRFSGLIASNRAGEPGYDDSNITIRGFATTGNNDVLVVVDGVPGALGGFSRLDPNDIESISVLKDASAAIYGSRAANGVILVTTKKGKIGKPTVSYSFNQGFTSPTSLPKLADAATYAQIANEIDYYNNMAGGLKQLYTDAQIQKFRDGSDPLNYPNTNWETAALKKSALQNQHNLNVNGGTEDVKYYMSLGTISQDGLYRNSATKYNQYNFRGNIDANITKRFKIGLSLSGRDEQRQYPTSGAGNTFRSIYRAYPTVVAVYPNGDYSTGIENSNPVALGTDIGGTNKNPAQYFNGILRASYQIPFVDGFSIDGFYSADRTYNFSKSFNTTYNLYNYNQASNSYTAVVAGGSGGAPSLNESQLNTSLNTSNIKLNYRKDFGKHHIDAFVGYEQSANRQESFSASRLNYPTAQTPELSQGGAAATDKNNAGSSYNYTRQSVISKINYNYEEKYLVEAQFRADGSSIFPQGKQWGYFPSISAGWRVSEEPWFKDNVKFIDNLKLRASYGQLGNDNVGQFQYYNNYAFNNSYVLGGQIQSGIDLIKLANPNITWEVAKKTDIGLNATFLKNFNIELIYFKQVRSDILSTRNASIPAVSGIVNPDGGDPLVPSENIGKVNSQGFEGTIGYQKAGPFSFGVSANATYAKSKIIFIDEAPGALAYQKQTGQPLFTYLLYNSIGIFRSQQQIDNTPHVDGTKVGDLIYQDYNKDGKINADDQTRTKYGNNPLLTYGLTFNSAFKNFDLSLVLAGQSAVNQYLLPESGQVGNFYSSWADNRTSPTNPNGSYPRVDTRSSAAVSGGLYNSTFWLNNASFVRLKNVELGYTLPKELLTKIKLQNIRVYASGFNLFTVTKVKDFDPEGNNNSGQFYPQQRIINLGVNVKF
ncbi:TonB-linked SusC/RagA family outer membrane protein [Pedobacter sp. UYP30]|uniref:SusC/RagA family TonB-linked outer membrane protein n=1 Tax=Pedobacter sp. UYP30 TaxID=1756400 RepID=UPI003399D00A